MAITRKNRVTPQHLEEVVSTYGYTLASVARETGIDRITLSKFRNHGQALKLEDSRALIEWMRKNELWEDDGEDDDSPGPRSTRRASAPSVLFPSPTFEVSIADGLDADDQAAALDELDSVVQKNNLQLATAIEYHFAFPDDLTGKSARVQNELLQGLAAEAILRRTLAGTFKARNATAKAATHADLVAQKCLRCLPVAGSATDPEPLADSSDENSVADAASAGAARGKGPSAKDQSFVEFVSGKGPSTEDSSFAEFVSGKG